MSKHKLYVTLGLIAIVAFTVTPRNVAQTQSACAPERRKEFVLTAVDKDGDLIDNLRAEHLSLKVAGAPATISDVVFRPGTPLDLAVLIDASASQEKVLPRIKVAARMFVESFPVAGQDRVAIVSFSFEPHYIQLLTADFTGLAAAIDQIQFNAPPGYIGGGVVMSVGRPPNPGAGLGTTSLWDVISSAPQKLFDNKNKDRRRVILLFSDGNDTTSSNELNPVIRDALKHDVGVFAIGLADTDGIEVAKEPLKKLSEQTGGIAEFPRNKKEKLDEALRNIARHLRGNYIVGYCGGGAKDRAKLQLEVVDDEMRKAKPVLAYKRY